MSVITSISDEQGKEYVLRKAHEDAGNKYRFDRGSEKILFDSLEKDEGEYIFKLNGQISVTLYERTIPEKFAAAFDFMISGWESDKE